MPTKKKYSPGYQQLLKDINASPALLSVLYDMGILPELVDDKKTRSSRECMIALMIGYKAGRLEAKSKPAAVPDQEHHFCHFPAEYQKTVVMLKHCFTNKAGQLFVGNLVGAMVDFCPICGIKAQTPASKYPAPILEKYREENHKSTEGMKS
jgi:hypothetical protein